MGSRFNNTESVQAMSDYNQVEKEYMEKAVNRGGILLFEATSAIGFVKRCREFNYRILGIDGFYLDDEKTQPTMEDSIQFDERKGFYQYSTAIEFIENRKSKGLYFEVVCDE